MSHLSHPNTARVFLYGQLQDGACYIVMECLEGKNLAQVVRSEGPMQPARAARIMVQVCGALSEAHDAGIVHRDLKPENIFLTTQGGIVDFPKVLDFGLAKVTEREMRPGSMILTQQGMVFGTPEFMSPEQAQGKPLDARSDIYSLGCILYEILTGKLPFEAAEAMDYLSKQIESPPILLTRRVPGLCFPPGLEEVVMRTLEKAPEGRYPRATDFAMALQGCLQGAVDDQAMASVPRSEESQQFLREGIEAALRDQGQSPEAPPSVSGTPEVSSSPWMYAALGAGVMLILGGAVIAALLLLR